MDQPDKSISTCRMALEAGSTQSAGWLRRPASTQRAGPVALVVVLSHQSVSGQAAPVPKL